MSVPKIYKIHILQDEKTTKSIHVFGGLGVTNLEDYLKKDPSGFTPEEQKDVQEKNIPLFFSSYQLHPDDTIGTVKMKIIEENTYDFSLEEMYLFCKKEETFHVASLYQTLTQNGKLELTKKRLLAFLSNIQFDSPLVIERIQKGNSFTYNDLVDLNLNERKFVVNQVLGQKLFLVGNEYPYVVNPFEFGESFYDEIVERASRKSLTTLNSHLLFSSGNILGNNIYLCLAEDVLGKQEAYQTFMVKLYYPYLMKKTPPILSLADLNENSERMREESKEKIQNVNETFLKVDLFYNMYAERKTEIDYENRGIQSLNIILHPAFQMKLPLDVLFKIVHATKEYPLIKYNPSLRQENIYRLYSEKISTDGRKIPFLSKAQIMKLKNNIAKTKSVAVYIENDDKMHPQSLICEFENNGDIHISCEFNKTKSVAEIDELMKKRVNPLLQEVKNYLEQSGYTIQLFSSLNDENTEIKQMNYVSYLEIKKPIKIESIQGCLSSVFIIESKNFKKGIEMRFKRVSNFSKTTSQEAFVIEKQKQKYTGDEIVQLLIEKYGMKRVEATELVSKMANELQVERNVKKATEIKINPGFKTTIQLDAGKGKITISVDNINDISYLNTIPIYLDSFIRLTQDKESTNVPTKVIHSLCSKSKRKEVVLNDIISLEEEVFSKQEIPVVEGDTIEYEKESEQIEQTEQDSDDDKPKNALDLFYGDDFDYDYEDYGDDSQKGGEEADSESDSESDPESEENELINIDGKSLTNPNPFFQKMREHDPVLFLMKEQGKFKRYSRACQVNYRRQPVILTQEEYDKINREKPGFLGEKDVVKYGSNPENPFYYTCPRYWCMKTNMPIDPAELLEKIDENGNKIKYHPTCGKVISRDENEIQHGSYIYEFFSPQEHGTQEKYIKHYPGFLTKDPHPDGLGVPCCFKKWQGKQTHGAEEGEKSPKAAEKDDYIKGPEKFPLDSGRWGFLPPSLEIFLKNVNAECQISTTNTNIKPKKTCLLRHGVETSEKQSFIACIADAKFYGIKEVPSIKEMRELILSAMTIDQFVHVQNGNLIESFAEDKKDPSKNTKNKKNQQTQQNKKYSKMDTLKYISSKIYNTLENSENTEKKQNKKGTILFEKIVQSYENFRTFMKDGNAEIDYTYLWDIVCEANPKLFPQGLNLVILNIPNNDTTSNIEIVCPSNHYSNEFYDSRKQTLILMHEGNYFEPIYSYRNEENTLKVSRTFSEFDNKLSPELRELFQKVIKPIVRATCKPLPSMPNVYKYRHGILLAELISLVNQYNYEIVFQVLHFNGKVIGLTIKEADTNKGQRTPQTFFVPCFPSSVDSSYDTIFVSEDESKIFSTYRDTFDGLNHLHELSKGKIPCKPVFKVVEDEIVIGILTETNQFVQIVNPSPLSEINDELKVLRSSNHLVADSETMLNSGVDDERVEYIKKIKLESQFYIVFRNMIRTLLNKIENTSLRETVEKESNLPYALYTNKLTNIIEMLKKTVKDNVVFVEEKDFQIKLAREIMNCNVFDKDKCKEYSSICSLEANGTICKLKIPKKNLVTGKNNEVFYYAKMADELVRYNRIKTFIFKPYVYLSFGNVDYQLKDDEILLLQSLLTQEYFDNLIPVVNNQYVKYTTFDTVEPLKSQTYDNYVKLDEHTKRMNDETCKTQSQKISSTVWKSCFPKTFTELSFEGSIKGSIKCGFDMISLILEKKTKTKMSIHEVKLELEREYQSYLKNYQEQILEILVLEGKKTMINEIKSGSLTFQNMIFNDSYFLSNMDIWLVMTKFQIPSAILSSKIILQTGYKKYGFVTCVGGEESLASQKACYILSSANREVNKNDVPQYKLIQSLEGDCFVTMNEECVGDEKWGDTITIEKYLSGFSKKNLTGIPRTKVGKHVGKLALEEDPEPTLDATEIIERVGEVLEEVTLIDKPKPILKKKKLVLKGDEKKEKQVKTVKIPQKTRKLKRIDDLKAILET
jgi:hypothetical protein